MKTCKHEFRLIHRYPRVPKGHRFEEKYTSSFFEEEKSTNVESAYNLF